MADTPQTTEADVAVYLGSKIAGSLIGGAADQLITSPVLTVLGIKQSDNTAARYFEEISRQLAALGKSMRSLGDQMRGLQDSLSQIKSIDTQIKDYLTHEALAQVLRKYNDHARTIQSLFELFVDDVSVVKDASTDEEKTAINDLYTNVLNGGNAKNVSEAMSGIHDLLVGPSEFETGILDHLHQMITTEIQKYAETDDNYRHTFRLSFGETGAHLPRNFQYYDCYKIVVSGYNTARTELPTIAALFKRIVASQLRGLILLTKAWQESTHAPTLGLRTSEVLQGISAMKAFYPAYRTTVNNAIADSLKKNGKYLPDDFWQHFDRSRNFVGGLNDNEPDGFLDHDWIMMRVIENETWDKIHMVYRPWIDPSKLPAGADRYCFAGILGTRSFGGTAMPPNFPTPNFPVVMDDGRIAGEPHKQVTSHTLDLLIYPKLNPLTDNPPEELASVLNGLPSSEEEALRTKFTNMLEDSALHGMALSLSFECMLPQNKGQDTMWLQGHTGPKGDGGTVRLGTRGPADATTSTAWRVRFTQTGVNRFHDVSIKCLGFDVGYSQYLSGGEAVFLAVNPDFQPPDFEPTADHPGGTNWFIDWEHDNVVSLIREQGGKQWRLEGHRDGSVSLNPATGSIPSAQWMVSRAVTKVVDMIDMSASHGMALSFKSLLPQDKGQDAMWLQGQKGPKGTEGTVRLGTRGPADATTSTGWRVRFTKVGADRLHDVSIKCLGFDFGFSQYLIGNAGGSVFLAVNPDFQAPDFEPTADHPGGTNWFIDQLHDNVVSLVRVQQFGRWRLEAHRDGSVSLTPFASDSPGPSFQWEIVPVDSKS
jgi:hypothetical protein